MDNIYYQNCKNCEYIYHCFGRETAIKIREDNTEGMYLHPDKCNDYYPEREQ